jgi:hypothetical protein
VDRAPPRLVDRGALLAALDRAAAAKVTIISAPAGSGKTSLLRAWADRPGQPHRLAVVQVQRDQQDAQLFWLGLLDAVGQASGTPGRAEAPAATPNCNGRAMVERVLSELADARHGITLVLDDLHELSSPDALDQLSRLLTSLPPNVHAILATRRDLPLGLHRLRLAGELTRSLLPRESARCSAWPRQTLTLKKLVSPSRHWPSCWTRPGRRPGQDAAHGRAGGSAAGCRSPSRLPNGSRTWHNRSPEKTVLGPRCTVPPLATQTPTARSTSGVGQ